MKALFTLLALSLAAQAHAAGQPTYIDLTKGDGAFSMETEPMVLTIVGDSAQKIFDTLSVAGTPGWEDVMESNKSAAGLYCFNDTGTPRFAGCTIQIDAATGIAGALRASAPSNPITISFSGDLAKSVYQALTVAEQGEDAEGYNFSKTVNGLAAQFHRLTNSYDVVIVADPAQGILQ